jgi:hypothetical protein
VVWASKQICEVLLIYIQAMETAEQAQKGRKERRKNVRGGKASRCAPGHGAQFKKGKPP